ncbi:hypothetical protein SGFS_073140 [Streptomyces graminofaciens]|uniref:Uncharacterized protein n=1 Tax=Streptomyces graminofaciens TaxID=68212 RepID=A0ABM7FIJ3_9ACTN|nr:hypothetical protein [Streptomyces graminofaciens]BBC36020.1 hypothetical protein SGFS_073140 [Streptomyces graminofaciens]
MVERLHEEYGLPRGTAAALVAARRVLPVFDGLDELAASHQAAFVEQLARGRWAWTGGGGYVLTCRTNVAEEDHFGIRATRLGRIVRMLPLDARTILSGARWRSPEDEARWQPVALAIETDPEGPLAQAFSSPWILVLALSAYERRDPAELLDRERFPGAEEITRRILDTADPTANFDLWRDADRRRWLRVATRAMGSADDTLLLWWRMAAAYQPMWSVPAMRTLSLILSTLLARLGGSDPLFAGSLVVAVLLQLFLVVFDGEAPRRIGGREPGAPRIRRIARSLLGGLAGCVSGALAVALAVGSRPDGRSVEPADLAVVFVCLSAGVGLALGSGAARGTDAVPPSDHRFGDLGQDRRAALLTASSLTALVGLPMSYAWWGELSARGWTVLASVCVLWFGVVLLLDSAWGRYRLVHAWLAATKELPWRLQSFLDRAAAEGLLTTPEGYGDGCHAFRHDLVRDALVARGGDNNSHRDTVRRFRQEVVDETLALPEAVAYIAYTSDGDLAAEQRAAEHVGSLAERAFDDDLPTIAEAGVEAYERFRQAHLSMVAVQRRPWWAGRALTFAYGALAYAGGIVLFNAMGLVRVGGDVVLLVWVPTIVIGLVVRQSGFLVARRKNWATPLSMILAPYAGLLALTPVHPGRLPTVALVSAALTALTLLAYLNARPHATTHRALHSEDPAHWPEVPATRSRYRDAALQARRDWLTALARDGVMPLLRSRLRVAQDPQNLTFPTIDPSRLTGTRRFDQFVATEAARQTEYHLRELESASIGVSGPRGAGKSSLMQRFCAPDMSTAPDDLLVLVPAPTSYDPREFLIHLFAEVCRRITGQDASADGRPGPEPGRRAVRAQRIGAVLAVVVGVLATIGAILWPDLSGLGRWWSRNPRLLIGTGGYLLAIAGIVWALVLSGRAGREPEQRTGGAEAAAVRHLRTLHYQLTIMRSRTNQLALPAGLQVADAQQVQHTEQVLTYPELVARFRALLDLVALERRPLGGRVVIGIDELDKLGSAEEAERFLNDLKVVFGIRGCHFLVAVSEDALTAFGRHVLDVRTAFDSAFDKVVAVPPLDLAQARTLLELRGVWLPEPYLWLCQVLSGGLPRDLLRAVMSLATAKALRNISELDELARELITEDAHAVLSAQSRHAATLTGANAPAAARWIAEASQAPLDLTDWEQLIYAAPTVPPDEFETRRAVEQVQSYLALCTTLLRTFAEGGPADLALRFDRLNSAGPGPIDRLTTARPKLAAEPDAAWAVVNRYRHETPRMMELPQRL